MSRIYTIETEAVVHHIDLGKIANIRHEPRGNRVSVFFSGGGETVVLFRDQSTRDRFITAFKALYGG